MSVLVKLDIHEDGHEIHESGIKLEADAGRTDMIAGGHQSFHCKSSAHGVVYSVLVRDSMPVLNKILAVVFFTLFKPLMFEVDDTNKDDSKDNIAKVTEEMVKIQERSQWLLTETVVVADVVVTRAGLLGC